MLLVVVVVIVYVQKINVYIQTTQAAAYKCSCVESTTYKYLRELIQNACVFELCYLQFFVVTADCPSNVRRSSQLSSIECVDFVLPFVSAVDWYVLVGISLMGKVTFWSGGYSC